MRPSTLVIFICFFTTSFLCWAEEIDSSSQNQYEDLKKLVETDSEIVPPKQKEIYTNNTRDALEFLIDAEVKKEFGKAVYSNQLWIMKRNEKMKKMQGRIAENKQELKQKVQEMSDEVRGE